MLFFLLLRPWKRAFVRGLARGWWTLLKKKRHSYGLFICMHTVRSHV